MLSLIKNKKSENRTLKELSDLTFDTKWTRNTDPKTPLYYMYRNLGKNSKELDRIRKHGLQYDITVLRPILLGQEYIKTAGHTHSFIYQSSFTYPEVYEVLEGEAIYLIQRFSDTDSSIIQDAYIVNATARDKIIIPPNYAHITINTGKKDLKMANWIAKKNKSSYKEIKKYHGGCYFALKGFLGIKWIKNINYSFVPRLKRRKVTNFKDFGLAKNKPMYSLVNNLHKLEFLIAPQKYEKLWERIKSNR